MKINTLLRSVLILLVILFYGGCDTKQIEFDISEQGLTKVTNAAPSNGFALYVSAKSVPKLVGDLEHYDIVGCTGESAGNRAIQVKLGIQIGIQGTKNIGFAMGENSTECIQEALDGKTTKDSRVIVLTKRTTKPPSNAVEISFK